MTLLSKLESKINRLYAFLLFGILMGILGTMNFKSSKPGDFYQYWLVGQAISNLDLTNVYSKKDMNVIRRFYLEKGKISEVRLFKRAQKPWKKKLELTATPFLYSIFNIFSTENFDSSYHRFRISAYLIFLASYLFFCYRLGISLLPTFLFFPLLTFGSGTFLKNVWFGNVNDIQAASIMFLAAMGGSFTNKKFYMVMGILLALFVAFKPIILVVPVLLMISLCFSDRSHLLKHFFAGLVLGSSIAIIFPYIMFGNECSWWNWATRYVAFTKRWKLERNFMSFFLGYHDSVRNFIWIGFLFLVPTLIVFYQNGKNRIRPFFFTNQKGNILDPIDLNFIGISVAIFLLGGYVVHIHYFVVATPLILICWRRSPLIGKNLTWVFIRRVASIIAAFMITAPRHDRSAFYLWCFYGALLLYVILTIDIYSNFIPKNNLDPLQKLNNWVRPKIRDWRSLIHKKLSRA